MQEHPPELADDELDPELEDATPADRLGDPDAPDEVVDEIPPEAR